MTEVLLMFNWSYLPRFILEIIEKAFLWGLVVFSASFPVLVVLWFMGVI